MFSGEGFTDFQNNIITSKYQAWDCPSIAIEKFRFLDFMCELLCVCACVLCGLLIPVNEVHINVFVYL